MSVRFCDLESPVDAKFLQEDSSLTSWYKEIREVPIEELEIGDICRAIRQELFLPYVLPVAFRTAIDDVTAGELYDGELLAALAVLPASVLKSVSDSGRLLTALKAARTSDLEDASFSADCLKLIQSLH